MNADELLAEANNPKLDFCTRVAACKKIVVAVNSGKLLPAILQDVDADVYDGWRTGQCR